MRNGIAKTNPITNSSTISPREIIRGREWLLSSAKKKKKVFMHGNVVSYPK